MHILRGFSMRGPPEYRIKSRAVDDLPFIFDGFDQYAYFS